MPFFFMAVLYLISYVYHILHHLLSSSSLPSPSSPPPSSSPPPLLLFILFLLLLPLLLLLLLFILFLLILLLLLLLLIKRYNLYKVLTYSTTFFHLRTSMLFTSSKTSTSQRVLGLPIGLLDMGSQSFVIMLPKYFKYSKFPSCFNIPQSPLEMVASGF